MQKIVTAIAVLVCAATVALVAQPGPGARGGMMQKADPAERAQKMTQMMKTRLTLTDEQAAQVQKIYTESFTREKALMEQVRQEEKSRQTAIENVLTPEQKTKLEQERQQMKDKMQQSPKRPGGQGGAPAAQ